jgi:hypothetical protein
MSEADALHDAAHEIRCDAAATDRWCDRDVPFALAVADLLDLIATRHQPRDDLGIASEAWCDEESVFWPCDHITKALTVATDYHLGSHG